MGREGAKTLKQKKKQNFRRCRCDGFQKDKEIIKGNKKSTAKKQKYLVKSRRFFILQDNNHAVLGSATIRAKSDTKINYHVLQW